MEDSVVKKFSGCIPEKYYKVTIKFQNVLYKFYMNKTRNPAQIKKILPRSP